MVKRYTPMICYVFDEAISEEVPRIVDDIEFFDGKFVLHEDHQQTIQSAVEAALQAAHNACNEALKNHSVHSNFICMQYIKKLDPSTIVQSVMQEQALQELAEQAQELDMGYGKKDWYTLEEIKQKLGSYEYGAELLLQHAMRLLEKDQ